MAAEVVAGGAKIMGSSVLKLHSLNPSSKSFLQCHFRNQRCKLPLSPIWFSFGKKGRGMMHLRKRVRAPVMALTQEPLIEGGAEEQGAALKVVALVTVRKKYMERMKETMLHWLDAFTSPTKRGVVLQLVSTQLDPKTLEPKLSNEAVLDWSKTLETTADRITYRVEFMVANFGVPGAITVNNEYQEEFFLESITFEGLVHFACNSWVQPEKVNTKKRIFFANKAYLPCQTPAGLKELREKELMELRGDGTGLRIPSDRIYDYDTYNDLGDSDKGVEYARPTLGGRQNPHPRRCWTGRPPTKNDVEAESREHAVTPIYVPRDEVLGEFKQEAFDAGKLKGVFRNMIPFLTATISTKDDVIKGYSVINNLYKDRPLPKIKSQDEFLKKLSLQNILGKIREPIEEIFKFEPPKVISGYTLSSLRDDEFGRQAVAGINPLIIQRLEVFPPISKLDPSIYGPQESAIKEEHIIHHLDGMSVQQALNENKLFILDYHDIYLPFLNRINALDDRKAYGTRTLFFLTTVGTLKPIAIELSLPPADPNCPLKQVLTPSVDATTSWLWQLGKSHVCSNDAGVHQLVHHCFNPFRRVLS
ncbi:hypothetical protein PVL29_012896 [Vitis rotundifolia]|uniref:Lipoxygenase n=1 Tax=Vitis rotundifolia TaxID=103349 RepID=A0AA39DMX0_VITRO|nr:hypothetical protein PVL29_012896 [Vitis rotundifolia]